MKRRALHIVQKKKKKWDSQMNTECTIGSKPGHCLCGMLTMGAKGQFRLHSSNCWRTQKLQELQTGWEPESQSSVFAWHGNWGHRPAPFPDFFLEGGLFWTAGELCVLLLLSDLLFGGKILKADSRVLLRKCKRSRLFPPPLKCNFQKSHSTLSRN